MKFSFGFIWILTFCCDAIASQFSLAKVDPNLLETTVERIVKDISADDTTREFPSIDNNQSFFLKHRSQRLGYLVPAKFNSKTYKNTICRLYFIDWNNKLNFAELFAEKNDDDDVVSSCVGIESVSIQDKAAGEAFYLAILRYRTINTFGSKAAVLTYKNGVLNYDEKTSNCVNANREVTSIRLLKKKLLTC